ncbi:hypothetical protein KM043_009350 [Ampulex compressa]|nr:hypothetical protein KM043_009350 [Ampulex compressa]
MRARESRADDLIGISILKNASGPSFKTDIGLPRGNLKAETRYALEIYGRKECPAMDQVGAEEDPRGKHGAWNGGASFWDASHEVQRDADEILTGLRHFSKENRGRFEGQSSMLK